VLKIRPPDLAMKSSVTDRVGGQTTQHVLFVLGNQAAVAGNIGRKNRRDLAFHEPGPGRLLRAAECRHKFPGAITFQRPSGCDER
jgi:hypothetical protein